MVDAKFPDKFVKKPVSIVAHMSSIINLEKTKYDSVEEDEKEGKDYLPSSSTGSLSPKANYS